MKKLVAGATGFIGSAIARELLKDGEEVKVFLRETSDPRNIDGLDVERAFGDIRDGDSMKKALVGCDTLYFTAAYFHHWNPDKKLPYEINVGGTKASLQAALEAGVEKVVYTSTNNTMGAHGPVPVDESAEFNHWKTGDNYSLSKYYAELEAGVGKVVYTSTNNTMGAHGPIPVDESAEFNHWKTGDHYSLSKYHAEVEAHKFVEKGLPIVIVNPTLVIGAQDIKPTPSGQMIIDVATGKMPGYIEGGTNVIDVEDVARGHIQAAKKGRVGERYLFGNRNIPVSEYFNLIAEIAGVKPPTLRIPYHLAVALGYVFEFGSAITKKPPVVTASEVRIGKKQEYYDCSKAVKELGLPQTPIEEAIRKALEWFRENGYIKDQGNINP